MTYAAAQCSGIWARQIEMTTNLMTDEEDCYLQTTALPCYTYAVC
jgi:hypothetical protein